MSSKFDINDYINGLFPDGNHFQIDNSNRGFFGKPGHIDCLF